MAVFRIPLLVFAASASVCALSQIGVKGWAGYGGNAQHSAPCPVRTQDMLRIRWSTPVDLNPPYSGNSLLAHYGSPMVTPMNTLILAVKTGASDGFKVEARSGYNGQLVWTQVTDYSLPDYNWVPPCGPTLVGGTKVAYPGAGGTIYIRDNADSASGTTTQYCFYGMDDYIANKAEMDLKVKICTPLTADAQGNIYFGYVAAGNSLDVLAGIAKIASDGTGIWKSAPLASGDQAADRPVMNCAPAISNDGSEVYMAFTNNVLAGMSTADLTNMHHGYPVDPKTLNGGFFSDTATSSPTVGPDGDVYMGGFENPFGYTHYRGYLYHFSNTLATKNYVGAFGWDDTVAIVPAGLVPSYQGTSTYLLMTKYNNYLEGGGNGFNKIGILDPNDFQMDPIDQTNTMKEILTKVGPTQDPRGGYVEWCINTAAVDPWRKVVIVNSEDGKCYRWNLETDTLSNATTLTGGIGEAYTPVAVGPDGTCYAINNAQLFAVGDNAELPTSLQMIRGTLNSGSVFDVMYSDRFSIQTTASTQNNTNDLPLQVEVATTAFSKLPLNTASLQFEVKMNGVVGDVTQVIEFFNYQTNSFETVSTRTGGNSLEDTVVTISSNASRFVNQTNKAMKARVCLRNNKLPTARVLKAGFGLMQWTVNP
ncbi:MAG: hypothetical protein JSS66_02035 [Armatimonadetes bacterium]|nr:hypothetical protein [Armatimonadota bacterium]